MRFDVAGGRFSRGNRRGAGNGAAAVNANGTTTESAAPGEEAERTVPMQRGDPADRVDQHEGMSAAATRTDAAALEARSEVAQAGRPVPGVTRRRADRAPNAVDHYSMLLQLIQVFPIISGCILFAVPSVWAARGVSAACLVGGSVWAVFWERARSARGQQAEDAVEAADGEELGHGAARDGNPRGPRTGVGPDGEYEGELVLPAQARAAQARILNRPGPPETEGIQILISLPLPGDIRVSQAPPRPSADRPPADRRSRRRDARHRRSLG